MLDLTWVHYELEPYYSRLDRPSIESHRIYKSTGATLTRSSFKTAKALGLEVPPTLLARADEVIE